MSVRLLSAGLLATSMLFASTGLAVALDSPPEASAIEPGPQVATDLDPDETAIPDAAAAALSTEAAEQVASEEAVASGDPVVVEQLTTETVEVTALPEGGFRAEISAEPVRTTDDDDNWVALDATLVRRGEAIEPKSAVDDLKLSSGGPVGSVLAAFASDGHTFTIRSPFELPSPSLEGDMATYADVLPGVDLVTKASAVGFSHNWVVKTPEAADDPRVRSLSLPIDVDGLEAHKVDGGIEYLDSFGVRQFWTPTPIMWDSSSAEDAGSEDGESVRTSADAVADGPVQDDKVALVTTKSDHDSLDLSADGTLLDDPDAVFPIVIDPPLTKTRNGWTAVWNNFPTKSFWNTDHTLGAGYEGFQQNKIVRSYFKFDTSALSGKYIATAELNVRQVHQASCSARATDVYRTGAISSSTTWNKQPTRYALQSSSSSTAGCGSGTAMVGWNVLGGTRDIASGGITAGTFMIRGRSETDRIGWKQYDDAGANLAVNYMTIPRVPTGLFVKTSTKSYPCGTSTSNAPVIGSPTVTIGATVSSADGASYVNLNGVFRRRDLGASTDITPDAVGTTVATATSGPSSLSWTVANKTMRFQIRTRSTASINGTTHTLYSPFNGTYCYFKSDTLSPPAPLVTSTDFAECATPEDPTECAPVGSTHVGGTFKLTGATSDAVKYVWSLNGQPEQTVTTTAGAERTITVVPDRTVNTLKVRSEDGANRSLDESFTFRVSKLDPKVRWTFDDPNVLDANVGGRDSNAGILTSSSLPLSNGRVSGALGIGGYPVPSQVPSVPTTGDFTVALWARVDANQSSSLVAAPSSPDGHAFELGYDAVTNSWTAGRRDSSAALTAASSPVALSGAWTHLAATYDALTKKVTLYVNGVQRATTVYSTPPVVNNRWLFGCGSISTSNFRCLTGAIDEVQLYASPLSSEEIVDLANPLAVSSANGVVGHPVTSSAGFWSMGDAANATYASDDAFGAHLGLTDIRRDAAGQPRDAFVTSDLGTGESVLLTPGISTQQARVSHAVADSMGSFTVAARVRLLDPARSVVLAQQTGVSGSAWTLGYEALSDGTGGRWVFQRSVSDSANATAVEVRTPVAIDPSGDFTLVQGVYDAREGVIRIFVDGQVKEDEPDPTTEAIHDLPFTVPWAARSWFQIANGTLNGGTAPLEGEVDYVEVRSGALDTFTAPNYIPGS